MCERVECLLHKIACRCVSLRAVANSAPSLIDDLKNI